MKTGLKQFIALFTVTLLFAAVDTAQACATCFGKSDSKLAEGMNWGILTLLFIIISVLGGISAFFIFIARRSAHVNGPGVHADSLDS